MPASCSSARRLHPAPPHSRSRGGLSAGSSDHPGRRSPHKGGEVGRRQVRDRLLRATRSVLADIEAALHLVERGAYGRCHSCGSRLSLERLAILPMARLCSGCQRSLEKNCGDDSGADDRATVGKAS